MDFNAKDGEISSLKLGRLGARVCVCGPPTATQGSREGPAQLILNVKHLTLPVSHPGLTRMAQRQILKEYETKSTRNGEGLTRTDSWKMIKHVLCKGRR